jgi:hypothetical protein
MDQNFWQDIDWANIIGKAAIALAILVVTWILAKAVKWAFAKLTERIPALNRDNANGDSLGRSLGSIAALIVWLFGLVAILQVFGLDQVLAPIQGLLNGVMEFLPNIIAAAFVFIVGMVLAKVVRELVETAVAALPFERWFHQADDKASSATGTEDTVQQTNYTATIAKTAGTVLYALIAIVVAIAALQILEIDSISRPAEQMLQTIFDAIPNIIAAAILLGIGIMIARFASDILGQLLDGLGADRALAEMDVLPEGRSATPVITKVVQIAIVLFFAVMAANMLGFPQITNFLTEVLTLGGKVLFGAAIIAVGFFIANLVARAFGGSGTGAMVVRYSILVLFVAMGLKYMGIADSIIELAFGALVVGGAAAAALAYGLGGRDAAARHLEQVRARQAAGSPASSGAPSSPSTQPQDPQG